MQKSIYNLKTKPRWRDFSDEKLLDLRLRDIYIELEKTGIQPFIKKLYDELDQKGLKYFKPHVWISDDWFTPDGVSGMAIPFYLTHPRLAKLEESQLYEIEGGTPRWFMQLLRHECGHAIDNAYRFRRRKLRQKLFGKSTQKYEDYYSPRPFSKKYVVHLDSWYSQSHPDEDFAETFSVWLDPRSNWKKRYHGWGALKKLEYVDALMKEVGGTKPMIKKKEIDYPLQKINKTLREHYREKKHYYGLDYPDIYDVHLFKIFTNNPKQAGSMKAVEFIKKVRKDVRKSVAPWTGTYQYTINQLLDEIDERVDELDLNLRFPFDKTKLQFISMISIITIEYLHNGLNRVPR